MAMTDPIADMLTRVRNAMAVDKRFVDIPSSNLKKRIAFVLKEENFIRDIILIQDAKQDMLRIFLNYDYDKKPVIHGIQRYSKPGCRRYVASDKLPRVLNGMGISILSTSKGVISDKKANKREFSFSELDIADELIQSHSNKLLYQEKVDTLLAYVIESKEVGKKGNIKGSKKLWIDVNSYIILKVEFYTGSGRLFRSIKCSNFHLIHDILFPMSIDVQDLKSKTDIQITIKEIELNPEFDMDIFIPKGQ